MTDVSSRNTPATTVKVIDGASALDRIKQLSTSIAQRAYEIFERNGRVPGRETDDWLTAEAELLHPIHAEISESNDGVTVRAEVPGYKADQLALSVDPRHVTITGMREAHEQHKTDKIVYSEHCADQIFRTFELPSEVDASKATAVLKDGVLKIAMPKVTGAQKARSATQSD